MANEGMILSMDWDISKAEAKQRKLNRDFDESQRKADLIKKNIDSLNESLSAEERLQKEIKDQISQQVKEAAKLEQQIEKVESGKASIGETMALGGLDSAKQKLSEMNTAIEKNYANLEKSNSQHKKISREIDKQNLSLTNQNNKTANIGDQILLNGKKQNKFTQAMKKSEKSAQRFGRRLSSIVSSALFFSVVTKALTALRQEFGKLIKETGTETTKLSAQLKGSATVLGRTLFEASRPAIEWVLKGLVQMVNILTYGLAKILGKSVQDMKKLAQNTKKTGEEAKKVTAGFDTLQTVDTSSSNGSDSSEGNKNDFGALNGEIDSEVALIMTLLSGALLVLGVILAFTGVNIPLGIGLIIAGAVSLATAVVPNWNNLSDKIQNTIIIITAIVSTALLVLGAIFAFTGHIALGVGFLILGAVGLATTVALSMNKLPDDIRNTVSIIAAIVSGALLVIGIILLATGVASGLGLGLLVAGAAGLAGTVAANWNSMPDKIKNVISTIMGIGGLLMLVIGLILTCTGSLPLGIPLIVIGAAGLVSAIALNWNAIVEGIRGPIGKIMAIIGASLIVLGILLLFIPGVGWGLGFGLILAGAAALGTTVAFNWNAITDKVKQIAKSIKETFLNCWEGIKQGFKSAVNGLIWLANKLIDGLNWLLTPVRGIIVGIAQAFGGKITLEDVKIPHIPKLATGAILPGGSPMLAWVNDQPKGQPYVEGSIDNIAAAFERYLGDKALGSQNITIEAKGNWAQFIKFMNLEIKKESNRASIWG